MWVVCRDFRMNIAAQRTKNCIGRRRSRNTPHHGWPRRVMLYHPGILKLNQIMKPSSSILLTTASFHHATTTHLTSHNSTCSAQDAYWLLLGSGNGVYRNSRGCQPSVRLVVLHSLHTRTANTIATNSSQGRSNKSPRQAFSSHHIRQARLLGTMQSHVRRRHGRLLKRQLRLCSRTRTRPSTHPLPRHNLE